MPLTLAKAETLAAHICDVLAPFCSVDKKGTPCLVIAGSIRRRRPVVNDIDLVLIPKGGETAALHARCKEKATCIDCGPEIASYILRGGTQLDLFFAHPPLGDLFKITPSNWGSVLLCRTGSKEHNIWLAQTARKQGKNWVTQAGIYAHNQCLASATEEDLFAALGLPYRLPEFRELDRTTLEPVPLPDNAPDSAPCTAGFQPAVPQASSLPPDPSITVVPNPAARSSSHAPP